MSLFVYIEQILRIHVGVALGSRQTRVAQQLLDRPKVSAALQQVSGKGVTESMGAGLCAYRGSYESPRDDPSDRSVGKWLPMDP